MQTLLIYDNTGYIYVQITGSYRTPEGGLQFIETEIPEGKQIVSVDVRTTPNVAIFEDIPPSDTEVLQQKVEVLRDQNAEMLMALVEGGLI